MTIERRIARALAYNPTTGIVTWRRPGCVRLKPGDRAGWLTDRGYRNLRFEGKSYCETHIIWVLMTGKFPTRTIDHKDRCPNNNRWANLRQATMMQQSGNKAMRRNNSSGYRGVSKHHRGKWVATIMIKGRVKRLGYFVDKEEAAKAYDAAARRKYGEFYSQIINERSNEEERRA